LNIYLSYRERIAGLFLLITALGVVLFIVGAAVKNNWLEPRIAYRTHVVRGESLHSGSPVLLSGLEVGEVGDLSIMEDNRIHVTILVRDRHAHRIREGTVAEIKRILGIGEKRIHLISPPGKPPRLPPGALLLANEPMDILDTLSNIDLDRYIATMDKAVATAEVLLTKLEEERRLERMMEAFDQMGPTMESLNFLLKKIDKPLAKLINDPSLARTFRGADRVLNDPYTKKAMRAIAITFNSNEMKNLIRGMDQAAAAIEKVLAENGNLQGTMQGANRLLNDGRSDRMLTAMESLVTDKKVDQLVENLAIVAEQTAKIGDQIPSMAGDFLKALREAVIVLKALQKTWLLDDEAKETREEMEKETRKRKKR
jgi:ABC-type transporter Mla subunit MlaD